MIAPTASADQTALASIRATGGVAVRFNSIDPIEGNQVGTRLVDLEERGGFRCKFPRGDIGTEAVFINTGGGMLGGDKYRFDVELGGDAHATVASQSAERVYRALDAPTEVVVALRVHQRASLAWLPQETILFDNARLSRRITAEVAADATLLMAEAIVFGRQAMGEDVHAGHCADQWRVCRDGKLVFAENLKLDGDMHATLQAAATGNGARACATVLYLAPDAEDRRDAARVALGESTGRAAVSAWNGLLIARFLAADASTMRTDLIRLVSFLARRPMPRVWGI